MPISLSQAIRTAIAAEQAAALFYEQLATKSTGQEVWRLLGELATQERGHAAQIEALGEVSESRVSVALPDRRAAQVETSPDWLHATHIDLPAALQVAIETEQHAQLYYDAMAGSCEGEVARFFERMARTEAMHATVLELLLQRLRHGAKDAAVEDLQLRLGAEREA